MPESLDHPSPEPALQKCSLSSLPVISSWTQAELCHLPVPLRDWMWLLYKLPVCLSVPASCPDKCSPLLRSLQCLTHSITIPLEGLHTVYKQNFPCHCQSGAFFPKHQTRWCSGRGGVTQLSTLPGSVCSLWIWEATRFQQVITCCHLSVHCAVLCEKPWNPLKHVWENRAEVRAVEADYSTVTWE